MLFVLDAVQISLFESVCDTGRMGLKNSRSSLASVQVCWFCTLEVTFSDEKNPLEMGVEWASYLLGLKALEEFCEDLHLNTLWTFFEVLVPSGIQIRQWGCLRWFRIRKDDIRPRNTYDGLWWFSWASRGSFKSVIVSLKYMQLTTV